MNTKVRPATRLSGKPVIPGDKSISHRALMFGALAKGKTRVSHLLDSEDVNSTWRCLEAMGVKITRQKEEILVEGSGIRGLKAPSQILDCGNSGTTIRHMMGILAGQSFDATLTGDASLSKRPMKRIAEPLRLMGAQIELTAGNLAPVKMSGVGKLKAIDYSLPVASAQLKSALLLAALYAEGTTVIRGLIQSRDHTERFLPYFGVPISVTEAAISVRGGGELLGADVKVPGDPSTAAFWIAGATLVPGSDIELDNISLNPTRTGFIEVLRRMGARIETEITSSEPEPVGKIRIRYAPLKGTVVLPHEVPSLVDEVPLLAVLACFAEGETDIQGAEELRVKESDRIEATAKNLRAMGAKVETKHDGFVIHGPQKLKGAQIDSMDDHRIAMAFSIAALQAEGQTEIIDSQCVAISYPGFYNDLDILTQ